MRACRITINNFRGVKSATLLLPQHGVLIGDNNTGKTTILEALDLVLGPDRLNRQPPIDEHDFFRGRIFSRLLRQRPKRILTAAMGSFRHRKPTSNHRGSRSR
ncbi:AAA family ATPase [Pseudochrobactrum sp. HB0163]|uniref:AAA family ATPase n=1 Tax=Pseudochrobactrum sp. HB0163 TaxID=3450708 RepID=UPI003F6DFEC8